MRPDFQLFLHVLGAVGLFGATAAVAILAFAARRQVEQARLAAAALRTLLIVALPTWVLMLVFGTWTRSKEGFRAPDPSWLKIGTGIANAGVVVLLAAVALAYFWSRRPASSRLPLALGLLSSGYVAALGVAWWVMSAKVPS